MSAAVPAGTRFPATSVALHRDDLLRYAEASGDHNPIHRDDAVARSVGLPGVIAHGMLTMGLVARVLAGWVGPAAVVTRYRVRFRRPVVVPAAGVVELTVAGVVRDVDGDGVAAIDLDVRCGDELVLASARAVVRWR